jgi:hypothetical protein
MIGITEQTATDIKLHEENFYLINVHYCQIQTLPILLQRNEVLLYYVNSHQ